MYRWCLMILIFNVGVISSTKKRFYFIHSKEILSRCIEDNVAVFTGVEQFILNESKSSKSFSEFVANRFYGRSYQRSYVFTTIKDLVVNFLPDEKSHQLNNQQESLKRQQNLLKNALKYALEVCSADNDGGKSKVLPTFLGESIEFSVLLDYILVDWPDSLINMIGSRNSRALLGGYTQDAQVMLQDALESTTTIDDFRFLLRTFWMCRAYLYFDGHHPLLYIPHRYTSDHLTPRTRTMQWMYSLIVVPKFLGIEIQ